MAAMNHLVSAEGMPSANNINGLNCQTSLNAHIDAQRVSPALSNPIIQRDDGKYQIGTGCDAPGPFPTRSFAEAVAGEVRHARTT